MEKTDPKEFWILKIDYDDPYLGVQTGNTFYFKDVRKASQFINELMAKPDCYVIGHSINLADFTD